MEEKFFLSLEGSSGDFSLSIFAQSASQKTQLIAEKQYSAIKSSTSESIIPAIHSILAKTGVKKEEIRAILTTTGPGSFTAIRVVLASVLGISLGLNIPVYTLDSLKASALAAFYSKELKNKQTIKVVLKAYKGEFYTANFSKNSLLKEKPTMPKIQKPTEFIKKIKKENFLVGNGISWLLDFFDFKLNQKQNFIYKNYLLSSNLARYLLSISNLENYKNQNPTFLREPEAVRNYKKLDKNKAGC